MSLSVTPPHAPHRPAAERDAEASAPGGARVLVLFAHPAFAASRVNRALAGAVRDLPHVCFHDLLECYPDFFIDVHHEQRLLREADLVVLQHPIYWYGPPGMLKHWQDQVLVHGFAYGEGGTALAGKDLLQVFSTGAPAEAYRRGGAHGYRLAELLRPVEQMARFCGMHYLPPLATCGGRRLDDAALQGRAARYRAFLEAYPLSRPAPLGPGDSWEA